MEKIFVPSICQGEDAKYGGSIKLRSLSYDERLDLYEEMPEGMAGDQKAYLKVLRSVGKKSKDFVKEVNLCRLTDGKQYSSWDEIYHDGEMVALVTEVCGQILGKM